MTDTLRFQGDITTERQNQAESGEPDLDLPLSFNMSVKRKTSLRFDLTSDSVVTLNLAAMGFTEAHVLCIVPTDGYVTAGITTADGTSNLSTDSVILRMSNVRPVTGLTLTRQSATAITVRVILAELSA